MSACLTDISDSVLGCLRRGLVFKSSAVQNIASRLLLHLSPANSATLSTLTYTVDGQTRRRGKGLGNRHRMLKLRKLSREHLKKRLLLRL